MPDTRLLIGPLRLTCASIEYLDVAALPGVYVLGRMQQRTFIVKLVGRADADLRSALLERARKGKYKYYIFDYFGAPGRAFERECHIFHDFGGRWLLDNKRHPQAPSGSDWHCPRCEAPAKLRRTSGQTAHAPIRLGPARGQAV